MLFYNQIQSHINNQLIFHLYQVMKPNAGTLEQKQTFLRTQILDSGVDPQSFMVFMGTVKGQGENIDLQNWTLAQLKNIVQQFKKTLQQQLKRQQIHMSKITSQQAANNYRSSRQVAGRIMGSKLPKKQKVFYQRDDIWDFQLRTQQQCRKTPQFFDIKIYPQVNCKGIEIKKTGGIIFGIGSKNYMQITLATNFLNNSVQRKSQDVDWLRSVLISQFPQSFVHPLQPMPAIQQFDKAYIAKRSKDILNFLNSLVHFNHLLNNKFTHIFLTENNYKTFENFKQKNVTIPSIRNIHSIQTFQGSFPLQISQRVQNLVKNSTQYSKQSRQLYRGIDQVLTKTQNDLNSIGKNFNMLNKDLTKLYQKFITLSQKSKLSESQFNLGFDRRMIAMLAYLKDLFATLQNHIKKQSYFVRDVCEQHVKIMVKQWNQFDNLQNRYKKQLDSYLTLRSSFARKKQQFFLDLSKKQLQQRERNGSTKQTTLAQKQQIYKAKFSQESKVQEEKRNWQGYVNYMYQKSFIMLLNSQEKQTEHKLSKIFQMSAKMANQKYQKYSTFKKYIDEQQKKVDAVHGIKG